MKAKLWFYMLACLILLSACQPGASADQIATGVAATVAAGNQATVVAAAQSATDTPAPTATPAPTDTPEPTPTNTLVPTATLTSTPVVTPPAVASNFLSGVKLISYDPFDNGRNWDLYTGSVVGGKLMVVGKDWSGLVYKPEIRPGTAVLMTFKYEKGAEFEMYLGNGEFNTDAYKRFGVYLTNSQPGANVWLGKQMTGNRLIGNLVPKPDTLYHVLMAAGEGGDYLAIVWDPANPDQFIRYRETIQRWENVNWTFAIGANKGLLEFDDLMLVEFSGFEK